MIRRLARDESGITMGLTVIMIVLIGVMGAGLLDANVFHYDGDTTTGGGESPWSCVSDANNVCTSNSGKVLDLGVGTGTEMRVWIKYHLPTPNDRPDLLGNPNYAPELVPAGRTNYELGRDFFRVISEGRLGNARRKIEAIYQTYDLGTPRAGMNTATRGGRGLRRLPVTPSSPIRCSRLTVCSPRPRRTSSVLVRVTTPTR